MAEWERLTGMTKRKGEGEREGGGGRKCVCDVQSS